MLVERPYFRTNLSNSALHKSQSPTSSSLVLCLVKLKTGFVDVPFFGIVCGNETTVACKQLSQCGSVAILDCRIKCVQRGSNLMFKCQCLILQHHVHSQYLHNLIVSKSILH